MKPTMRVEVVQVIRWDCWNPKHRHTKEVIAQRCIDRKSAKKRPNPLTVAESRARNIAVTQSVICGTLLKEAGKAIGVSASRCREIVIKILRDSVAKKRYSGVVPQDLYHLNDVRRNKDFFLERIDALAKEWGV